MAATNFTNDGNKSNTSENILEFLINHFEKRTSIIQNANRKHRRRGQRKRGQEKEKGKPEESNKIVTTMSESQKNGMINVFDNLLSCLKKEGFNGINDEIVEKIDDLYNGMNKNENWDEWESGLTLLNESMKLLRPFNIDKMLSYYNEFNCNVSDKLLNRDIILFVGRTGAGKSSTIHFIKGTKFIQDPKHNKHYLPQSKPSKELNKIKLDWKVSQSVTRCITPVTMTTDEINTNSNNNNNGINNNDDNKENRKEIILCDTPGFGDTGGDEIELANSLSLVGAMHKANKVHIILVLSCDDIASRSSSFKKIGDNMDRIMQNYKKEEVENNQFLCKLNDISVIFTKFKDIDEIDETYEAYMKEDNAKSHAFHLAKRIVESEDDLLLVDLIDGDRNEFICDLFDKDRMKWIGNTQKNFVEYIPDSSMEKIKKQVSMDEKNIQHLIDSAQTRARMEQLTLELVKLKLNRLQELEQLIKKHTPYISYRLKDSIATVERYWTDICENILKGIQNHDNMRLETFDKCCLNAKQCIEQLLTPYTTLQEKFFKDNVRSSSQVKYEIYIEFNGILGKILRDLAIDSDLDGDGDTTVDVAAVTDKIMKCLIVVCHFEQEKRWQGEFSSKTKQWLDHCQKWLKMNRFGAIKICLEILMAVQVKWNAIMAVTLQSGMFYVFVAFGFFFFFCKMYFLNFCVVFLCCFLCFCVCV